MFASTFDSADSVSSRSNSLRDHTVYLANMKHSIPSLLAAGLSIRSSFAQVNVPPGFEPNVKWQIVIQNTIDINASVEPADALVWDLDLYHLARNPGIVDHLRVWQLR